MNLSVARIFVPDVGAAKTFYQSLLGLRLKSDGVHDGFCVFEDGTLAGAHLDMASALRNTVEVTGLSVPEVAMMASTTPAHFLSLGATHGGIAPGMRADLVWLGADLQPRGTWIGGAAAAAPFPALAAQ